MDSLFYIHEENEKVPLLRIPLSVLITYKGFKALAIANVALKGETLFNSNGQEEVKEVKPPVVGYWNRKYNLDPKFIRPLGRVGIILNLQAQEEEHQKVPIAISKFLQVHKFIKLKTPDFPARRCKEPYLEEWYLDHLKDLKYEDIDRLYYLLRSSEILPFDIIDRIVCPDQVLRPELVCSYPY
jgi:hypothetical protein